LIFTIKKAQYGSLKNKVALQLQSFINLATIGLMILLEIS